MKPSGKEFTLRQAALIAGFSLVLMVLLAVFSEFMVRGRLIIPGDPVTTAKNVLENQLLFRLGIIGFILVFILDVIVSWALYMFLAPASKNLSLLTAMFRLVYAASAAVVLVTLVVGIQLLIDADSLATGSQHAKALALLFFNSFTPGWSITYGFFGIHMLLLGYLVFKSGYAPRIIGVLIIIAGIGYLVENFGNIIVPEANTAVSMFTFWGELVFIVWLLIRGGKRPIPQDHH